MTDMDSEAASARDCLTDLIAQAAILVVDDEPGMRNVLAKCLSPHARVVVEAASSEEAGTLPQLRHAQVQGAKACLQLTVSVAVAPGLPPVTAFVAASADQPFDVVLHQGLEHRLGDGAEKVSLVVLLQQLDQGHVGLGHRGLHRSVVEVRKLHHHRRPRWLHRRRGAKFHHVLGDYLKGSFAGRSRSWVKGTRPISGRIPLLRTSLP
ncbi:hypothetical protein SAMN04515678_11468 [Roseivivax sediminis]|uniref:Response regulatory domain-containing protein n=1 Tax=Roseivivax sediminis TaxID=936889 RepID=A0A1I2CSI4_9RHOB|nr:hypothetical protein SAMN04515678_11468 [Roseivivax sediminis]